MKQKWFIRKTDIVQRSSDREIETVKLHLSTADEGLSFWVDFPYKDYLRMVEADNLNEHLLKMIENEEGADGYSKKLEKMKDTEVKAKDKKRLPPIKKPG